jgi:2-keto-4-pentenoate hydratase/2-oxohepta-3-ene-1,7-dioic acid hydratase in catechol pathway
MKIVLFEQTGAPALYGIVNGDTVSPLDIAGDTPQEQLLRLIDSPDVPSAHRDAAIPLAQVRLLPPVPRPGKIVVTTAVYGASAPPQQLLATLKSPESVIGPGQTVRLPAVDGTWQFVPQAALGIVIRGPAKDVKAAQWQRAVFGYTSVIDVMARGDQQFGRDYWLAKADTLGPLGPCIVTVDEIPDPASLRVRSWQNGGAAQDFRLADASHSIPEQVELVTTVMTLNSGDVLVCGSSPEGQRPVSDGERVAVEIDRIGRLEVRVGVTQPVEVHA